MPSGIESLTPSNSFSSPTIQNPLTQEDYDRRAEEQTLADAREMERRYQRGRAEEKFRNARALRIYRAQQLEIKRKTLHSAAIKKAAFQKQRANSRLAGVKVALSNPATKVAPTRRMPGLEGAASFRKEQEEKARTRRSDSKGALAVWSLFGVALMGAFVLKRKRRI